MCFFFIFSLQNQCYLCLIRPCNHQTCPTKKMPLLFQFLNNQKYIQDFCQVVQGVVYLSQLRVTNCIVCYGTPVIHSIIQRYKDIHLFSGGFHYLHVGKPNLNIRLDSLMAQPDYVSLGLESFTLKGHCCYGGGWEMIALLIKLSHYSIFPFVRQIWNFVLSYVWPQLCKRIPKNIQGPIAIL